MTELPTLLAEFESTLLRKAPVLAGRLRPGIPEELVRERLALLGLDPPREVVEWFAWHDGATYWTFLTPFLRILTLEEGIDGLRTSLSFVADGLLVGRLPLFSTVGGDYGVADCHPEIVGDKATLGLIDRDGGLRPEELGSLSMVIRWWTELFESGQWHINERFVVESDLTPEQLSKYSRSATHAGYIV